MNYEQNMFNQDLGIKLYQQFVEFENYSIKRDSFEVLSQIIDRH